MKLGFKFKLCFYAYSLACVAGETRARTDSLAQASRSRPGESVSPRRVGLAQASRTRLSESGGGPPKSFFVKGRPGDQLIILSEQTTRPGERGLA